MSSDDKTVAVPVELIERYLNSSDAERWPEMANKLRALIPKPKPRLVAARVFPDEKWDTIDGRALADQPDLLTVLDGVIDDRLLFKDAADLKKHIRKALGVEDAE
jgi:hypothetical protein